MKRFRFPLEAVLTTRRIREEEARRQLVDLRRRLEDERRELDRLRLARLAQAANFREAQESPRSGVADFLAYETYLASLADGIAHRSASVNALAAGVEAKRLEVVDRSRQRKVVERLRERRLADYKARALKEEQDFLNEIGVIAYGRRARSFPTVREGEAAV